MKQSILEITINRPQEAVFEYVIDPNHSPDWIDSFKQETATPWPPRIGTIYHNSNYQDQWSDYRVEAFKPPRHFGLALIGGDYHAEYLFSAPAPGSTLIKYHEWVERGELSEPVKLATFEKLKNILESL